ncbi:hypothetical protein Tco_0200583 [Tanacetum coccineum]
MFNVDKTKNESNKRKFDGSHKNVENTVIGKSFVSVVKTSRMPIDKESPPAIVLEDDCLNAKDLTLSLMGRVKEMASLVNLKKALCNEGFDVVMISYLGELWEFVEGGSTMVITWMWCINDLTEIIESQGEFEELAPVNKKNAILTSLGNLKFLKTVFGSWLSIHRSNSRAWNGGNDSVFLGIDKWYDGGVIIKEQFPRMFAQALNQKATVISKMNAASLENLVYRRKSEKRLSEEMQLNSLAEIFRMTTLVPCEDRYVWTLENDGVFSVASNSKEIDRNRFRMLVLPIKVG